MEQKILVAKSYIGLPIVSEPYNVNGKEYVKVRLKNGTVKQVRSYSEAEYRKYNPEVKIVQKAKPQSEVFGFGEQGFIWIFKGDTYAALDWFRWAPTRYAEFLGWYLPSDIEMPEPLPAGIEPIKLYWNDVKDPDDNDKFMDKDLVKKYIETLIYDKGTSQWMGEVGDKLTVEVTCNKTVSFFTGYGESTLYSFIDKAGNNYTWTTSTNPGIQEGNHYQITGKVKKLDIYKNQKVTTLTRVKVNSEIEDWDFE